MKDFFAIIGVTALIGTVAYILWNNKQEKEKQKVKKDISDYPDEKKSDTADEIIVTNFRDLNDHKNTAAAVMSDRHQEASKIIKEAVENICTNSNTFTEDNDDIEQISKNLDDLLGE